MCRNGSLFSSRAQSCRLIRSRLKSHARDPQPRVRVEGAQAPRNGRCAQTSRFVWGGTPQGFGSIFEEHGSGMQVSATSSKKKWSLQEHKKEAPSLLERHAPRSPVESTCLHRAYQEPPLVSAPLHSYPSPTATPLTKHSISAQTCRPCSERWGLGRASESFASPRPIRSRAKIPGDPSGQASSWRVHRLSTMLDALDIAVRLGRYPAWVLR